MINRLIRLKSRPVFIFKKEHVSLSHVNSLLLLLKSFLNLISITIADFAFNNTVILLLVHSDDKQEGQLLCLNQVVDQIKVSLSLY